MSTSYTQSFYNIQSSGSRQSAALIAPIVMDILHPKSVVDVGCGVGTWLAEFAHIGVADYLGMDGSYVPRDSLEIPASLFHVTNLAEPIMPPRRFELVISVEVAEHLPPDRAADFIGFLTKLGPAVLFSAAIPGQGGVKHINERWQDYWRGLFRRHNYLAVDAIRPKIWGNAKIEPWYQQNIILYAGVALLSARPELRAVADEISLNVVHPAVYENCIAVERGPRAMLRNFPHSLWQAAVSRLRNLAGNRGGTKNSGLS